MDNFKTLTASGSFEEITIPLTQYGEQSISVTGIGFIVTQCDDNQATIAINNPQSPKLTLSKIHEYSQRNEFEKLYFTIYNTSTTGLIKLLILKDDQTKISEVLEYIKQ
ncbi:MAG: hypothetical protein ACP5L4_06665, partial [Thermoplasmata archaeon]